MSRIAPLALAAVALSLTTGCATRQPAPSPAPVARPAAPETPVTPSPPLGPVQEPAAPPAESSPQPLPAGPAAPAETAPPAAAPVTPRPPAPPGQAGRQIVLNFDGADIEAVIQAASEIVGFNYTLAPGVAGKKVTVQTSGRIPEDEVFNVLLAVLEVNGVTAIRSGNLYKIVPLANARERPVPTVIGSQPDPSRRDDEIITQIVPVSHGPAERIAIVIRPFVQGANVMVQGSLLIITDTAANVARLLQIVGILDVETAGDELRFLVVRYADAVEMARMLNEFFTGRRVRTATPTAVAPTPPRPGGAPVPAPVAGPVGDAERPPLILADKRTNTLVMSARRGDLDVATRLVSQLDVDTQANKRVFVYYVENVKAKELAGTLADIFGKPGEGGARPERRELGPTGYPPPGPLPTPGPVPATPVPAGAEFEPGVVEGQVKVVADEPNNALIVTTFPRNWPLIEDTIRKLDRTPKQVLIEVLVAELTLNDENRLGLEWTLRTQGDVKIGGNTYNVGSVARVDVGPPSSLPGQQPTATLSGIPVAVPPVAGFSLLLFETDRFLSLLNLYANYNQLSVLSSPAILTSENKKAVINVSNSIPIVTQQVVSQTGTVTTQVQQAPSNVLTQNVEYRDAGIVLTVTPRISDKRVVSLDVKQTVNDVGNPRPPSGSPDIIKRETETSVVLRDNQTLVLGGLIQTKRSNQQQGIPFLSKIPVIGFLFGVNVDAVVRTELLLMITPRVVGDPTEAQELVRQFRSQRPDLERSLRSHPSILRTEPEGPPVFLTPPRFQPAPTPPPRGGSDGR